MFNWFRKKSAPAPIQPVDEKASAFQDLLQVDLPPFQELVPATAKAYKWESIHEFHPTSRPPVRTASGLQCSDPPIAMICPECSCRNAPLMSSPVTLFSANSASLFRRHCNHCGLTMIVQGTKVLAWHERRAIDD